MFTKEMTGEDLEYFRREGLDRLVPPAATVALSAYTGVDPANATPYPPDAEDLARLHRLIRERRVLTVLEFGVGASTVVIADALAKNRRDYGDDFANGDIRCLHPFQVHSVDASAEWVAAARARLPEDLRGHVFFHVSEVYAGTFMDRLCHYYRALPNIVPDFIYLDGPAGTQVAGNVDGSDFAENYERTVLSADLLRIEPTLAPGTFILVDGRANNARFLKRNFQRCWTSREDGEADITTFELIEAPLGIHNRRRLEFHGLADRLPL